jgi:ABC-type multidrug transport system permease subunit
MTRTETRTAAVVSPVRIARDQLVHATVALWRTQVVLIFTFAMPLVWLVLIGILAGNDAVGDDGVRIMQFAAPTAIAMGTFFATMPPVAISVAEARESGVLKRLRGTPLPAWGFFFGQIGAAFVFALGALIVTLVLSVVVYQVRLRPETLLASAVTLLLGVVTFSAVGLAIGSVSRTASIAEAAAIGAAVVLSFISGLFLVGATLPSWLDALADVFPLKPYANLLQDQFNPFVEGAGWNLGHLAVLAAWGVAGALISLRAFRWERRRPRAARPAQRAGRSAPTAGHLADGLPVSTVRRPSAAALVTRQAGAALRGTWRRPGDIFFSLAMPVGLFALLVTVQPTDTLPNGQPVAMAIAASMVTWGVGVTVFMNLAESVARARDSRLLKRMRGTPIPAGHYLAGRTIAGLVLTVVILVAILVLGAAAYDLRIGAAGLLLGLAILLLGALTLAACGFLLITLVPSARAVGAVGLIILFLLAFFSDVFLNTGPEWMGTVGALFPLKHPAERADGRMGPLGTPGALAEHRSARTLGRCRRGVGDPPIPVGACEAVTISITEAQRDVRRAYVGGFFGQLVSGMVWLAAAAAATWISWPAGIATLFLGGVLIFPLTTVALRLSGRPATLPAGHPMAGLAMQIAFTVPLGLSVVLALSAGRTGAFFAASMVIVGAHYLPFVFLYGMRLFAVLAGVMVVAGVALLYLVAVPPVFGGWFTGALLVIFAVLLRTANATDPVPPAGPTVQSR